MARPRPAPRLRIPLSGCPLAITFALLTGVLASACGVAEGGPAIPSVAVAEPAAPYAEAVEAARSAVRGFMRSSNVPGLSVAVGIDGEIVWSEGFGYADLADEALVTPTTLFPVGSLSMPLTAVAIGRLYERGEIDLDAPIQRYVPDFPEKESPITLRQLMGHRSGIRNEWGDEARNRGHCESPSDALGVFADEVLRFTPGESYRWSTYGWTLASAAVEGATGDPFTEVMEREVLGRLGLEHTAPDTTDAPRVEQALPYEGRPFRTVGRTPDTDLTCVLGAGGYLSTPADLVRFGFSMMRYEALDSATVETYWTPGQYTSGSSTGYGLGWFVRTTRYADDQPLSRFYEHGSTASGGTASLVVHPELGLVVAVVLNQTGRNAADLSGDLVEVFQLLLAGG